MKFTTFVKSYMVALAEISSKTMGWKEVYIGDVIFPNSANPLTDGIISYVFSSSAGMDAGTMGLRIAFAVKTIEALNNGFENTLVSDEYVNKDASINEAGRFLVTLHHVLKQVKVMCDNHDDVEISSVVFNLDKGLVVLSLEFPDGTYYNMYTDGSMTLFGV